MQLRSVRDDISVAAINIGMLANVDITRAEGHTLNALLLSHRSSKSVVLNPVCESTSGPGMVAMHSSIHRKRCSTCSYQNSDPFEENNCGATLEGWRARCESGSAAGRGLGSRWLWRSFSGGTEALRHAREWEQGLICVHAARYIPINKWNIGVYILKVN